MNNETELPHPRIAIIEGSRRYAGVIADVLKGRPYDLLDLLVTHKDTLFGVVKRIRDFDPHLIITTEKLYGFWAPDVLRALGGKFFCPHMIDGNPRVICTCLVKPLEMGSLSGGFFYDKDELISSDLSRKSYAQRKLLNLIAACVMRTAAFRTDTP